MLLNNLLMDTPVIVNINNNTIITTPLGKELLRMAMDKDKPKPFRLTMIRFQDNCQFCTNPKGDVLTYYVSFPDRWGFLSCAKCSQVAEKAANEWLERKGHTTTCVSKAIRCGRGRDCTQKRRTGTSVSARPNVCKKPCVKEHRSTLLCAKDHAEREP